MSETDARRRFRFGPRDRRGLIAGVRTGQAVVVVGSLVVAVGVIRVVHGSLSGLLAVVFILIGVSISFFPVAGQTIEEWLPVFARFSSSTLALGRSRAVEVDVGARTRRPPGCLAPFEIGELTGHSASHAPRSIGFIRDGELGVWSAVLAIEGEAFALLGERERDRRIDSWSALLAAAAHDARSLYRLQWIERTVPDARTPIRSSIEDFVANEASPERAIAPEPLRRARQSYAALHFAEAERALRHELFLVVSVRGPRARRSGGHRFAASGTEQAAADNLSRQLRTIDRRCREAGMAIRKALSPGELRTVFRQSVDSAPSAGPMSWPWPLAMQVGWSSLCTDGTWHASYWIAEWPRSEVGNDFLLPLLIGSSERRSLSVVMVPVQSGTAVRAAEHARTSSIADAELRQRHGFSVTARTRREHDAVSRREGELADGHAAFRFSGYVTVTGTSRAELEASCARIEQAAALSRLELRRLYGAQSQAFCYTLPTGRGCV